MTALIRFSGDLAEAEVKLAELNNSGNESQQKTKTLVPVVSNRLSNECEN